MQGIIQEYLKTGSLTCARKITKEIKFQRNLNDLNALNQIASPFGLWGERNVLNLAG